MGQSLRILAISDSPDETHAIERELRRGGYETTIERDENATRLCAAPSPAWDLVLSAAPSRLSSLEVHDLVIRRFPGLPFLSVEPRTRECLCAEVARVLAQAEARRAIEDAQFRAEEARRQAAGTLRESEERYRALIESTFDLVCEMDAEGRCAYASPNWSQHLGYTAGELLDSVIFERIHPDDADKAIEKFANLMAGRPNGPFEFRHEHKNGEWVWLEGLMRVLRSGDSKKAVLIARDIGERRRHERELSSLISLAKAINAQRELPAIAWELRAHLQGLLPCDAIRIAVLSGDELIRVADATAEDQYGSAHLISNSAPPSKITRLSHPDHPAWQAIARGQVWMVNRWAESSSRGEKEYGERESSLSAGADLPEVRAFIKVPLIVDGEIIGLLSFDSWRPYVFTDEHARLAGMAGEQVAVAIQQVRLLEKSLRAESKYRALVQDVDAIVWEADPDTLRFTFVSPQAQAWLGFPLDEWQSGADFWASRIHPDDREAIVAKRQLAVARGQNYKLEYRVHAADGRTLWLRDLGTVEVQDNKPVNVRGLLVDISSLKSFESTIVERNTVLKAVQEAAADGICVMDNAGTPVSLNRRFIEMWPIPDEMVNELRDKRQIMAFVASKLSDSAEFTKKIGVLYDNPDDQTRDEIRLQDGRLFECYSAPAIASGGDSFGRVWSFRDITERERYEQQLAHQAFHDPLTDLPNRVLFMNRLTHAISRAERVARPVGVLFLDLDRFKIVNDSLGHPVGDQLLKQVAARIERSVRPTDTAARFGGDEFTVLVEEMASPQDAIQVAERILEGLQAPFNLAGHEVHVTGSIGIALSTSPEDNADDLLRKADVAMYWSKNKGSGRYEVFDTQMNEQALERLQLEIDLRQAVKREQLHLRYQPLVHLESGRIIGTEALLRWNHPTRGNVSPAEFIPIAEETGMILPIGQWVLREACAQARQWQSEFPIDPPLKISINISAKQLEQPTLSEDVARVLEETNLDPRNLELEITESVVMENVQANIDQLETLRKLGVKLAIDDFGTGYSSLSYLEHFPLDILKIDRTFVGQIGQNGQNGNGHNGSNGNGSNGTPVHSQSANGHHGGDGLAILKAVSTLGQTLGVSITAEGIETAEQRAQLAALSCEVGQGYHFAEPLEASAVDNLLRHNSRL